jgi:hypothetical protein
MQNTISYVRITLCFRFMKQNYIKLHSKATKLYERRRFLFLYPLRVPFSHFVCRCISINWLVKVKVRVLTYCMGQSCFWKTNQCLRLEKKFPSFLWNAKILCRAHTCPALLPIRSQLHLFRTAHSSFLKIPSMAGSHQWTLFLRCSYQHPVRKVRPLKKPGKSLRFPEIWGNQIWSKTALEFGKIVSPTHRPP